MKILKKFLSGLAFLISISITTNSYAETIIRPSKLETRFYQMGFRNSSTGEFASVFSSADGQLVDLSSPNSIQTLAENTQLTNSGTFDQMYVLVSNTVSISGDTSNGCYIKGGNYSYSNGAIPATTQNSSLSGTAIVTETGFGGVAATTSDLDSYKTNPAVTSSVNGKAVNNLTLYLVNKTNRNPGSGGPYNRYLYLGDLQTPINLTTEKKGTLWIDTDTSESVAIETDCTEFYWSNTKFGLSVEQ